MTPFDLTPIKTAVQTQYGLNLIGGIRADLLAGGGDATMGHEVATDIPVDIAINYDADAILMQKGNDLCTEHPIINTGHDGQKLTNKARVMMVGNSVSLWLTIALVSESIDAADGDLIGTAA
jgi:DNA (cytosine-5)-methyltransferase 1